MTNEQPTYTSLLALPNSSNKSNRICFDLIFVLIVVALSAMYFLHHHYRLIVLNAYFAPIILSGLFLGWLRASSLALLGFSLVLAMAIWDFDQIDPKQVALVLAWGATLGATGGITGLLFSTRELGLIRCIEHEAANALTDVLTKVPNRRAFDVELGRQHAQFQRYGHVFSLLMLDIDHFKKINDQHGHAAGDYVLEEVAKTILKAIREYDLAARFGGEEFAVILPNTKLTDAVIVAERLRADVQDLRLSAANKPIPVTASIGVAVVTMDDSSSSLLERADQGLYAAKRGGRNMVQCDQLPTEEPLQEETDARERRRHIEIETDYEDLLTNLPSNEALMEELRRRIEELYRYESAISICVGTITNADEIQSHGAEHTNRVVKFLTKHLTQRFRATDVMAWQSPDRFVLMFPHTNSHGSKMAVARIVRETSQTLAPESNGERIPVTLEYQVASAERADTVGDLFARAEQATPIPFEFPVQVDEEAACSV